MPRASTAARRARRHLAYERAPRVNTRLRRSYKSRARPRRDSVSVFTVVNTSRAERAARTTTPAAAGVGVRFYFFGLRFFRVVLRFINRVYVLKHEPHKKCPHTAGHKCQYSEEEPPADFPVAPEHPKQRQTNYLIPPICMIFQLVPIFLSLARSSSTIIFPSKNITT